MPLRGAGSPAEIARVKDIERRLIAAVREMTGRGPDRVRVYLQEDLLTVLLRDQLTRAEQALVAAGEGDAVVAQRRALQGVAGPRLKAIVEAQTKRRVVAFFSDHHVDPDVAIEAFLLAPAP